MKTTYDPTRDGRIVIENTLVKLYGYEASIPLRAVVASSPRYATLLAIAANPGPGFAERLAAALPKFVKNPKTKAQV
jgi:hypothetical protein